MQLPVPARIAALAAAIAAPASAQTGFEAYYDYVDTYPSGAEPGFADNAQGLTTDGVHWYWTQANAECDPSDEENSLWKFPVGLDLATVDEDTPGVERVTIGASPLGDLDFWHFGDLTYHAHGSRAYLVIAVERQSCFGFGCKDAIAIYDAETLGYLGHFFVCDWQDQSPWAAVGADGDVYASSYYSDAAAGHTLDVHRYDVDWDLLGSSGTLAWSHVDGYRLQDESGGDLRVERVQGGGFSPSGELLFLSTMGEYGEDPVSGGCVVLYGGIQVFHAEGDGWNQVAQSTVGGDGPFVFAYDPCEEEFGFAAPEEPEGLAIWDFDGGPAPGVAGQLHVIMLDNDAVTDDVYLKHYTNRLRVGPGKKFSTVSGAVSYGWDGTEIRIDAGTYAGGVTAIERMLFLPVGGVAVVGG